MAQPTSRQELKDYCLRQLGFPVIEINVDDSQLEDRLDDALQTFSEYHFDGVMRTYFKHQVTSTDVSNGYIDTDSIAANAASIGVAVENGRQIMSVTRVFEFSESGTNNIFSVPYQIALNDLYGLRSPGMMSDYTIIQNHLSLIRDYLDPEKAIRFSRVTNRLYLDMNWGEDIQTGQFIVLEAYVALNPDIYTEIYNDRFLKKYVTALFKKQWGANLSKYESVQLPGGVSLNGSQLYSEGNEEVEKIEEQMADMYELPPDIFTG